MDKDIYDLELHETTNIGMFTEVLRVPGGWIYTISSGITTSSVFIPYSQKHIF